MQNTPALRKQRVIAVDFDDVIASTNKAFCRAHNEHYGTDLTLDDVESSLQHRNRGWGTIDDVGKKLRFFHESDILLDTEPVLGLERALTQLKAQGHPLHIVTARGPGAGPILSKWLKMYALTHFFDGVHFTGPPEDFDKSAPATSTSSPNEQRDQDAANAAFRDFMSKFSKVATLERIGARLLIDDNVANTDKVAAAGVECLLFGDYRWNSRRWEMDTPEDTLDYEARIKAGIKLPEAKLEMTNGVTRVSNWEEVVEWVAKNPVPRIPKV